MNLQTAEEIALKVEEYATYEQLANPIIFASLVAIEFAKIHVTEALKEASEQANLHYRYNVPYIVDNVAINKYSILNAYPLNNIK